MLLPAARAFSTLLLYLVACPAGWQPLESGLAGQDRTLLALACVKGPQLLGLKLPDQRLLEAWSAAMPGACLLQGTPALLSPTPLVHRSPQSHLCWVEAGSLAALLREQDKVCAACLQRCLLGPVCIWPYWAGPGLVPHRASGPPNPGQEEAKEIKQGLG